MNIGSASIKGMNSYIFNEKLGRYEQISWYLTGKSSLDIATEYKLSEVRIRQYALEKKIPYVGTIDKVKFYVFDEAAEEVFKNRKTTPGREPVEKPPRVPGKPCRPRKEKIVNTSPKRSVGRPRKNPAEALDIVPKRRRGKKKRKK